MVRVRSSKDSQCNLKKTTRNKQPVSPRSKIDIDRLIYCENKYALGSTGHLVRHVSKYTGAAVSSKRFLSVRR